MLTNTVTIIGRPVKCELVNLGTKHDIQCHNLYVEVDVTPDCKSEVRVFISDGIELPGYFEQSDFDDNDKVMVVGKVSEYGILAEFIKPVFEV